MQDDDGLDLTRRRFAAGLAGLAALGGPSLVSAQQIPALRPRRGGTVRIACDSSSVRDTLDPAKTITVIDLCRATLMYNRLIDIAPDGTLQPALAESWDSNIAADEWLIRLRKDVTFHNGKTMSARDVAYTIRRVLDPVTASGARTQIADIDGGALKIEDDQTLRIKLNSANADLPGLLALYQLHIVPDGHTDFSKPIGTGPFVCRSFEPGTSAVFARNPQYWRGGGLPYLDGIETVGIADSTARFNALLADDVQAITKVDANLVKRAKSMPDISVLSTPGPAHTAYPMRSDAAPYDNLDIRLALKSAVDRKRLLELAYAGQGTIGFDHPVPAFSPFFCSELPGRPYDPDKVKFHLRKAGHENTVFELTTSTIIQNGVEAATIYAEMASQAGAKIKVVQAPADGYYSATWMKKPWAMSSWWGRPTIDSTLSVAYVSSAPWNEGAWRVPAFDQLVKDARGTTDFQKRKQLYWDAQKMLYEEGPSVIPIFLNWLDATSSKIKGLKAHPMGNLGWFIWDGVWLDA
jgi:peptide/nickel transport system substrate-binding protein